MSSQKVYAIILARSGSKGIKNKNLQIISDKSLLEFSINAALHSSNVDNVFVSSDSNDYLKLAKVAGAIPVSRPSKLSDDTASSEEAILHVLDSIKKSDFEMPKSIIFMQCTSPFTTSLDLDEAYDKFIEEGLDSLFSAIHFHGFLWNAESLNGINHDESLVRKRRQDIDSEILENGAFYIFKTNFFISEKNRFLGKKGYYLQEKIKGFEIDDNIDLEINRFIHKKFILYKNKISIDRIKLIVSDFDGVFTNNTLSTDKNGNESVVTSKADSLALTIFKKNFPNIPIIVLTSEQNISVKKRCEKLKIECFQAKQDKKYFLKKYLLDNDISKENVVYIGNDKNDISCLKYVGYPIVVNDCDSTIIDSSYLILNSKGGEGAIKELLNTLK